MHRLARFADARNTAEGKFVAVLLSVLLVFSFLNVTMFTDRANAGENDLESSETTLSVEDKTLEADEAEDETEAEVEEVETEGLADEGDDETDDETDGATLADEGEESEDDADESDGATDAESGPVASVEENDKPETSDQPAPLADEIEKATASLPLVSRTAPSQQWIYCYGLVPGGNANGDADSNWYGLAKLSANTEPPTDFSSGTRRALADLDVTYPVTLPEIHYNGATYQYAAPGSGNENKTGFYTVEWNSYATVANGVNAGGNKLFEDEKFNGNSTYNNAYHLDCRIAVNQVNSYTVQFKIQQPESAEFELVSDSYYYVKEQDTPFSALEVPTETDVPNKKVENEKGYDFEGWYLDEACTEKASFNGDSTLQKNTVFYGRYVAEKHMVIYMSDDKVVDTQEQNCKESFTAAGAPEKTGYSFLGWTDGNGNTYQADQQLTMPHANLTLTAQWEPNTVESYTVRYLDKDTDNSLQDDVEVTAPEGTSWKVGDTIPVDFSATQKLITGYDRVEPVPTTLTLSANADENVVTIYYQKRTDISYTVKYVLKGSDKELADQKVVPNQVFGSTVTENAKDIQGYTVVEGQKSLVLKKAEGNEIIFEYTANNETPYKVKHYQEALNGDYVLQDIDELTGITGEEAKAVAKVYEGFTCVETIPGTLESGIIQGDGSLELSLYYKRNTYTVSYAWEQAPGAAGTLPRDMEYKFGQAVTIANKPEVEGYIFEGWTPSPSVTIDAEKNQFTMPAENVVLAGNWVPKTDTRYVVTFYYQNADGTYPSSATEATSVDEKGTTDTLIEIDPFNQNIPAGYEFDADADNKLEGIITADEPLTLKVYYKRADFSVTYAYEGTVPEGAPAVPGETSKRFGVSVDLVAAPTLAGYTFDGWKADNVEVNESGAFVMPANPVAFTGEWIPRDDTQYVVQYYYEEQGAYPEIPTKVSEPRFGTTDTKVSLMAEDSVPQLVYGDTRTFVYDKAASTEDAILKGDDTTVLKVYFKQQINLTFQPGEHGTFEETTRTYNYGDKVVAPEAPGKQGYTFTGWTPALASDTTATENGTYIAQWAANEDTPYTVEYYYMQDGVYPQNTEDSIQRSGTTGTVVELTEADKTTNEADYAYDAEQTEKAEATSAVIAGDETTVLKVYFKQNFTVKFTTASNKQFFVDDAATEVRDLAYGAEAPATPKVDREKAYGWKLTGWKNIATGEVISVDSALPKVTNSATYEAQWEANEDTTYRVVYEATEGGRLAGEGAGKQLVNDRIPVVTKDEVTGATAGDPDPGYRFDGWYKSDENGGVYLTSELLLDRETTMGRINEDPSRGIFSDTTFLAKFSADWTGLAAHEIDTTYDGTEKNLIVSGLVAGDKVMVDGGEWVTVNESGSLSVASYENVTNKEVTITVKRGSFEKTLEPVKVVIKPAQLTIKKELKEVFTGFAYVLDLTSEDVEGVAEGQTVDFGDYNANKLTSTDVGVSEWKTPEKVAVKIKKTSGVETTDNYEITVDLKITIDPLTIEPSGEDGSESKMVVTAATDAVYDGRDHKFIPEVVNTATTPQTVLTEGADKDYTVSYYRVNADGERVATTDFRNVGTIIAVVTGVNNYKGSVERTYQITPLPVTVTAANLGKVYGAADPTLTASVADQAGNAKPNDGYAIQYTVSRVAGEATGDYAITATGERTQGNYVVSFAPGVFTISPAGSNVVTVSNLVGTNGLTKTYDGEPTWVTPTASVAGSTFEYSLDGRTWTAEAPTFTNAGSYNVWVRANAANYSTTPSVRATVTINPRPVTITVNNASKVRGEADPVFTGSITEGILVNANDLGAITFSRTNRTNAVGIYPGVLTANYADNDNYTVTVQLGDFTVRAATTPAAPEDDDPNGPGTTPTTPGRTTVTNGTPTPTTIDDDDTPMADGTDDTDFDTAIDDAGVPETIDDEATSMTAAPAAGDEAIDDDATPMGAFEDDHADCWVHWIMILGIVATAIYGIAVVRRRLGLGDDVDDYEDQIMGRNDVSATTAMPADGRQAL